MRRELLYPVFLEAIAYTEDGFWKQIFEELAYGFCPYGSYFNKGFLCCSYKGKEFSYKVDPDLDPEKIYTDIYGLLAGKLGVSSSSDKAKKILDFEKICSDFQEIRNSKWSSIKRKTSRDYIIENYIVEMKKKHALSDKETKRLMSYINVGLLFKTILPKDIDYENGKIISIANVSFENSKVVLGKSGIKVEPNAYNIVFQEKGTLVELWRKYIKDKFNESTSVSE